MARLASVQVRRVLTETPLARQHEKTLEGKVTRKRPAIDFARFDRSRYPRSALALASGVAPGGPLVALGSAGGNSGAGGRFETATIGDSVPAVG